MAIKQEIDGTSTTGLTLVTTNGTITPSSDASGEGGATEYFLRCSNTVGNAHDLLGFIGVAATEIEFGDIFSYKMRSKAIGKSKYAGYSTVAIMGYTNNKNEFGFVSDNQIYGVNNGGLQQFSDPYDVDTWYDFKIIFTNPGLVWMSKKTTDTVWLYNRVSQSGIDVGDDLYFYADVYNSGGILDISYMKHESTDFFSDSESPYYTDTIYGQIPYFSDSFADLSNWDTITDQGTITAAGNKMVFDGMTSEVVAAQLATTKTTYSISAGDEIRFTIDTETGGSTQKGTVGISLTNVQQQTDLSGMYSGFSTGLAFIERGTGRGSNKSIYPNVSYFRGVFDRGGVFWFYSLSSTGPWQPICHDFWYAEDVGTPLTNPDDLYIKCLMAYANQEYRVGSMTLSTPDFVPPVSSSDSEGLFILGELRLNVDITTEQVFKAIGYLIGSTAAASAIIVSGIHTLRRIIGKNTFQMSAGDSIKENLKIAKHQESMLQGMTDHMDEEKKVWRELLNLAQSSSGNNVKIVALLEKIVGRFGQ